jgi:hypothetical protein
LAENGQTLAAWLNAAIDKELKAVWVFLSLG